MSAVDAQVTPEGTSQDSVTMSTKDLAVRDSTIASQNSAVSVLQARVDSFSQAQQDEDQTIRTELFFKYLLEALMVVLGGIVTWYVAGKIHAKERQAAIEKERQAAIIKHREAYAPMKIEEGVKKNTVLVVGLGRTGKTQLINALIEPVNEQGIPIKHTPVTDKFSIRTGEQTFGDNIRRYYFTDYRGQSFAELISNFILENLQPNTILRYGDINSLILVVDLFRFNEEEDPEKSYDKLDRERIKTNIFQWNETALDAVFGLLTQDTLTYVCLFINKIDKWTKRGQPDSEDFVLQHYEELISNLEERTHRKVKGHKEQYADFQVIVGSARGGDGVVGVNGLLPQLAQHSVPI